jgi:hypothetical protein
LGICSWQVLSSNVLDELVSNQFLSKSDDDVSSWSIGLPKQWTDQIAQGEIIQLVFKGHQLLLAGDKDKSRQCLIQLACISGDSFDENSTFLPAFVRFLLELISM